MRLGIKLLFTSSIALVQLTGFAARPAPADAKEAVLRQLDVAAANFHSTSADVEFDVVQSVPIYEKDIQKGTAYYKRDGKAFQMAARLLTEADDVKTGKQPIFNSVPKTYVYSGGTVKLYEKGINQVTTLTKVAQYQSWFMLGFGASGKDLEQKWDITYVGPETIDGVKTVQLVLVPLDAAIKKNLPKVTIWVDPVRGVSLKQVFDEGEGQSRTCIYSNIKVNQSLPSDAFTLGTDPKNPPTYINQ
jgi:outer membrane lipoprotein-sorting protein